MTEIILHAGFHKTGSSSIQETLAGLDPGDTAYLDWGDVNHSMPFLDAFTDGELTMMTGPVTEPRTDAGRAALERLGQALANPPAKRLILSAEAFSVAGYQPGLAQLRALLAEHSARIRVIAYIRPLDTLIASDFQQCARAGLPIEFGRNAGYLQRMSMLDQVFGRENVEFHVFSPPTLIEGDVVRDFAARTGIEVPPQAVRRVNESASLETVAVARCAALFGEVGVRPPVNLELNYFAAETLAVLGNTRFRIAADALRRIVGPHAEELAKVQQRIGGLFPEPSPSAGGIASDADLFAVAGECMQDLIAIVEGFAARSPRAARIVAQGLDAAAAQARTEVGVARLVDTIKRVRLAEAAEPRAA